MTINNDLMELVNGCGVAKDADTSKVPVAKETADLLSELGFTTAAANVARKLNPILKLAEIAAGKYIEITPSQIQFFLERKASEYNKKNKISDSTMGGIADNYGSLASRLAQYSNYIYCTTNTTRTTTELNNFQAQSGIYGGMAQQMQPQAPVENFRARTNDYSNGGEVGQYIWTEVAVEQYAGIPPLNILRKFKDEKLKKIFDYFTVASVNAIKDPLLLGRVEGSQSRFFLGQWGNDVSLDDII